MVADRSVRLGGSWSVRGAEKSVIGTKIRCDSKLSLFVVIREHIIDPSAFFELIIRWFKVRILAGPLSNRIPSSYLAERQYAGDPLWISVDAFLKMPSRAKQVVGSLFCCQLRQLLLESRRISGLRK